MSSLKLEELLRLGRAELEKARPQLLAAKEIYEAYIASVESHPACLFMAYPPLASGGFAVLGPAVESECSEAVVGVLKHKLATLERAIGITTPHSD